LHGNPIKQLFLIAMGPNKVLISLKTSDPRKILMAPSCVMKVLSPERTQSFPIDTKKGSPPNLQGGLI